MKVHFFLWALLAVFQSAYSQSTSIRGRITNSNTGLPLAGASITLNNSPYTTLADINGFYTLNKVKAGQYALTISFIGYATLSKQITVRENETLKQDIGLQEKIVELEDVQVFGKINEEKEAGSRLKEKKANDIMNAISAQAMERSPDINAANVLQRMSGLTILRNGGGDEAYPIIRGLDPGMNNTLVNGVKIASPDDKSRYVPLNIVPSDLLASIEVHKSLTPEMEGDAIGGTVNMIMKDAPANPIIKILGSIGYSKIFFDRKFDYFSKADIQQKSVIEKYGNSSTAQPGDFSRSNLDFKQINALPNAVAGITYGRRFFKSKLGLMVAENFQDQTYGSNSIFNQAAPDIHTGQPAISDYATRRFSTQQINNGLTAHLDYNFNDHNKLTLTSMFLYSHLAQARVIVDTAIFGGNGGRTVPGTGPVSTDYLSVTSQQYIENLELEGKHILSKHFQVDWISVYAYSAKRVPDMADLALNKKIDTVHTTNDIHGPYTFVETPNYFDAITRIWQHNQDQNLEERINLTWKSTLKQNVFLELKAGGLYRHKTRFNIQDQYILKPTTNSSGVKQVFENIYTAQWTVYNSSGSYDYDKNKYRLFEDISDGYLQARISSPKLDIIGGVRFEQTNQGYTLNTFYATGINGVTKNYLDVLPSLVLKYKANERTNIRLSYYKATSRPNFYDLVPALRYSASSDNASDGNPYLNHTIADNYDIRYEFYPHEDEQFFAGVFYKKLINPIEYAYESGTTFKPTNSDEATVYGAEIVFTRYINKIGFSGNYTYLYSKIYSPKSYYNLSTGYINPDSLQKRSLQGQTDHTLNLSVMYRNSRKGFFAELAFQYIGTSIAVVYPIYGYDYYQQPQSNLAFSAEKLLKNRHLTLFTKINNLLNAPLENKINTLLTVRDVSKFNFSIGLRYAN